MPFPRKDKSNNTNQKIVDNNRYHQRSLQALVIFGDEYI